MTLALQQYPILCLLVAFAGGVWVGFLATCLAVGVARADRNQ